MKQQQNLAVGAAMVLYSGAMIRTHNLKNPKNARQVAGQSVSIMGELIAITVLMIVLSFTIDQVPEFGGPLALLIIVAALVKYSGDFGLFFNETQRTK